MDAEPTVTSTVAPEAIEVFAGDTVSPIEGLEHNTVTEEDRLLSQSLVPEPF